MMERNGTDRVKVTKTKMDVRYITRVGILSALAFLIMLVEVPILPPPFDFLKLDFSEAIALFGGVAFGPLAAIFIELIKNLLKFMLNTQTGGIGELANFIVGVAYVVPIALVYRKISSQKGLLLGMLVGSVSMIVIALISNYFIFLPLWGIADAQAKMDFIKNGLLPFNAIKAVAAAIVGYIFFNAFKGILKYLKMD
ncbi:MAG: ECF transporter S component [Vallitaleaceae bacterium]|nr:ECF transporter S component [Vallitaleaceae bacterium]